MCYNYSLIILLDGSGVIPLPTVIMHRFVNVCYIEISIAHWVITSFGVYPYGEDYSIYPESNIFQGPKKPLLSSGKRIEIQPLDNNSWTSHSNLDPGWRIPFLLLGWYLRRYLLITFWIPNCNRKKLSIESLS